MLNNRMIRVAAVAGAICAGAALYGCSGGGDSGSGTTPTTPAGGAGGAPGSPGGANLGQMMGGQGGGMMGGMGGGQGSQQGAAGATIAAGANTTPPPHRADPFKPTWPPPPPPNVLSFVAPVRIADLGTAKVEDQPNIEIHEVPQMRVAGILSGSGIYALLEGGPGDGSVVKPGDTVGDYRVASINQDSLILKKTVKAPVGGGTQTYTQVVPLTDSGASASAVATAPIQGGRMSGPGRAGIGLPGAAGRAGGKLGGNAGSSE